MVCSIAAGTTAAYYLSEKAEYYSDSNKSRAVWYAPGGDFGLIDGQAVDSSIFTCLHDGMDTVTGDPLTQYAADPFARRTGGFDLTFSAPKSVSIIWATADEATRTKIESCQIAAVRGALGLLNAEATFTRRGNGGKELEKINITAALFQHGDARPVERADGSLRADPNLHTHAVVLNLATRADGSIGAIDGRHLFHWKMALGATYRSELALLMEREFCLEIERADETGLFEIAGVPEQVRNRFSQRRAEIKAALAEKGLRPEDNQPLAAAITKITRARKNSAEETDGDRHTRWREEAKAVGFGTDAIRAAFNGELNKQAHVEREHSLRAALDDLPSQLTTTNSTFSTADLYRAVAAAQVGRGEGADSIPEIVHDLEFSGAVIPLGVNDFNQVVWSTPEMIAIEREVQSLASKLVAKSQHSLDQKTVRESLATRSLSVEQAEAVWSVTTGADVVVIEGPPGTGKSSTLQAAAKIYQSAGRRVIGCSTAWRIANTLGEECRIEAKATDAWLAAAARGDVFLDNKTILFVDEAGQLSSRQVHQILTIAHHAGAKVVLVGDERQLQAIGAGPGLRIVAEQTGITRLDEIHRQQDEWARQAVRDFAIGRSEAGFAAYLDRGLVNWADGNDTAAQAAVDAWLSDHDKYPSQTQLLLAKSNRETRAVNDAVRSQLKKRHEVGAADISINAVDPSGTRFSLPLAAGDYIRFGARNDKIGVINGTAGKIRSIRELQPGQAQILAEVGGRAVDFSTADIANAKGPARLGHAYSSTIYGAQGLTVDRAIVLGSPRMSRNDIYVATSRARLETHIIVNRQAVKDDIVTRLPLSERITASIDQSDLIKALGQRWSRADKKAATMDFLAGDKDATRRLANERKLLFNERRRAIEASQTLKVAPSSATNRLIGALYRLLGMEFNQAKAIGLKEQIPEANFGVGIANSADTEVAKLGPKCLEAPEMEMS